MQTWYERWPDRLDREVRNYAEQGLEFHLNEHLFSEKSLVVFEGTVCADDGEHSLRVVYSPMFPHVGVEVLDIGKQYRRHQNPKAGNLCLPHWQPDLTGADRVIEAIGLMNVIRKGAEAVREAEIPAPEPESTWYRYTPGHEVLIPEMLISSAKGDRGGFALALRSDIAIPILRQGVLVAIYDVASESRTQAELGPLGVGQQITGYWVRVTEAPPFSLSSYDEWLSWAISKHPKLRYDIERQQKAPYSKAGEPKAVAFAVVYPEEGPYLQYHDQWQVCVRRVQGNRAEDWIMRPHILPSKDTFFQRTPSLRDLAGKRIVVLGLGALGSIVATELARAGVSDLVLVDHDDFRPGNVVRHACDLRSFGMPKALACALQISYINPASSVRCLPWRIGMPPMPPEGYEDELAELDREIEKSHLLVSTICDSAIEGWIDETARSKRVPCVFAGVFYEAWGGQVFVSRPDEACFRCYERSDEYGAVAMPAEQPPMYLDGCSDPSFPGAGFDTSAVANLATRLCAQILLDGEGYPAPSYNLISWSSRDEDGGDFPRIERTQLARSLDCRACNTEAEMQ